MLCMQSRVLHESSRANRFYPNSTQRADQIDFFLFLIVVVGLIYFIFFFKFGLGFGWILVIVGLVQTYPIFKWNIRIYAHSQGSFFFSLVILKNIIKYYPSSRDLKQLNSKIKKTEDFFVRGIPSLPLILSNLPIPWQKKGMN